MTVFNKFARTFKSHWLLYLCVIVFGITNLVASSGAHMVQRLLFFVLTILVVKRISSLPLRLLVAAPFVLLTAADMSISLYSWCTFGTTFNDGFAISVLQSDPDEVVKMLGMYIPYLCAFAFLSLLFLKLAKTKIKKLTTNINKTEYGLKKFLVKLPTVERFLKNRVNPSITKETLPIISLKLLSLKLFFIMYDIK